MMFKEDLVITEEMNGRQGGVSHEGGMGEYCKNWS